MLHLEGETDPRWAPNAVMHLDEVLIDHAQLEKKAASHALQLLFKYPEHTVLLAPLSALAREELEHFELVLGLLAARGTPLKAQAPTGYQARLFELVRGGMPDKRVDSLLCGALIEARSCERFRLLSEQHPDAELRQAFRSLLESEARHHSVFVRLAEMQAPREVVRARLEELAQQEVAILERVPPLARIHS